MKVYQVVDGELISIELSPLAQRMFFHGKKCTSDGFVDYRDAEQKKDRKSTRLNSSHH